MAKAKGHDKEGHPHYDEPSDCEQPHTHTDEEPPPVTNDPTRPNDENLLSDADVDTSAVGSSTGLTQSEVGSAYRVAGSENIADTGQAESWVNLNLRRAQNQEDYDQQIRSQMLRDSQLNSEHNNRVRAIQENSLQLDNEALQLTALRNPVWLDMIVAEVVKAIRTEK